MGSRRSATTGVVNAPHPSIHPSTSTIAPETDHKLGVRVPRDGNHTSIWNNIGIGFQTPGLPQADKKSYMFLYALPELGPDHSEI